MAETRNQTLSGEIALDGETYVDVLFKDARLIYRGGVPPRFQNCAFDESSFSFMDSAAHTLNFLRAMSPASSNMRAVVLGLMPELND